MILSKLKFEQIDANNQCTLLFTVIEMIAAEECKSIQDFAEAKGQTPFEVWSKFCGGILHLLKGLLRAAMRQRELSLLRRLALTWTLDRVLRSTLSPILHSSNRKLSVDATW